MRKLLAIFLIFLSVVANAQIPATISTGVTIPVGPVVYKSNPEILFTTATVSQISCVIKKPNGITTPITLTTNGDHRCTHPNSGMGVYDFEIEASDISTVGYYKFVFSASDALSFWQSVYVDYAYDLPGRIASGTAATESQATRILSGVGNWGKSATDTIVSAHQITDGLIQQVTPYVVAGGRIIPSTGCTYPEFYRVMEGHMGRYLMLRALSLSSATPELKLAIREDDPGQSTPILEDALTYMSFASHYQVAGVTPTEHCWYVDISNLSRERWYSFACSVRKEGVWVSGTGALIMNPTPELSLSETPLSETTFTSTFGDFISDVSQTFRAMRKGFEPFTVFRTDRALARALPGVSSEASRSLATEAIYAITRTVYDYFSEEYLNYIWYNDQDSIYGENSKMIEGVESVSIRAASDGVTVTAAGEEE